MKTRKIYWKIKVSSGRPLCRISGIFPLQAAVVEKLTLASHMGTSLWSTPPPQSSRVAQELYYLIMISCWEEQPSTTCLWMRCEGCKAAVMPTPSFGSPESQGKLLTVNQRRYISISHGKGKLENRSCSSEMHGMLY